MNISVILCMSPCSSDYIFSNKRFVGIWHIVSGDSSEKEAKPQGLKPHQFCRPYGTTKVVPFHKPCASRSVRFPLAFPADCLHPSHFHTVLRSRSAGYSDFPAYSQILLRLAKTNLRTVIVTAAVHRGFSSKLHLAVDLSL